MIGIHICATDDGASQMSFIQVNSGNTRTMHEIFSNTTLKAVEL